MANILLTEVEAALAKFGQDFVRDLGYSLDRKKDTTGKLRGSIKFRVAFFTEYYTFKILLEDYYKWVDEGRKAGKFPPINKILSWISRKGIGHVKKKGLKVISEDYKAQRSLAFLIGRSIKKKGIKPTHFFKDVKEDGRVENLRVELSKALKRDVIVTLKTI